MTIREAVNIITERLPIELVAGQDNVGLIAGDYDDECRRIGIAYELTGDVVGEAVENGCDLLITYHTPLFRATKSFTTSASHRDFLLDAVRSRLNVFAVHTAIDVIKDGLNFDLGRRLGLTGLQFLSPLKDTLFKLAVLIPGSHVDEVRHAMAQAGAGRIGNYEECSFNMDGQGTFLPGESASPFLGKPGQMEKVEETKVEFVVEKHRLRGVLNAMFASHPYEEVAYDIYPLSNTSANYGFGIIGEVERPIGAREFLNHVKKVLDLEFLKVSGIPDHDIRKVAICAGSGMSFYGEAVKKSADVFVTGDVSHHDFREARLRPTALVDATHHGTEKFVTELMYGLFEKLFRGRVEVKLSRQRLQSAFVF